MDTWKLESSPGKQTALAAGFVLISLVLAPSFRNFGVPGSPNSLAGFLLGMVLLLIGGYAFLANGKQTMVVDPKTRRISITDENRFETKKRSIAFGDITDTRVGYFGKARNFATFYYVVPTPQEWGSGDPVFAGTLLRWRHGQSRLWRVAGSASSNF